MRRPAPGVIAIAGAIVMVGVMANGALWARAATVTGDVKTELRTTIFHAAELAQRATALVGVRVHVQHVINCLEGPNGADFKTDVGYPCEGMGHGIIPDLKDAIAAKTPGADQALKQATLAWNLAVQGISKNDVQEIQAWARVVANHLNASLSALGSK